MSNCFVCLNKAYRKVCPHCQCYAHSKCWGKYLQHDEIYTTVNSSEVNIFTPSSVKCPQCRKQIKNVKPITRSDTNMGRTLAVLIDYSYFLSALDDTDTQEEKNTLYHRIFLILITNKYLIRNNESLRTMFMDHLRYLYQEERWKPANMYHYNLFGNQISKI